MRAILGGEGAGLALACVAMLVATGRIGPADAAQPRCDESIRVLLEESGGPLRLELAGRTLHFEPDGDGLRVDGRPQASPWRGAPGVARVGRLEIDGRLEVLRTGPRLAVVGTLPLEDYVVGAVAGEVPALWSDEALRAQAVASRTYALHQRVAHRERHYDVEATTTSQVYVGLGAAEPFQRAVRETRCQVLTWAGAPILAAFHSASGGHTASAGEVWGRALPYLVSQEVAGEDDSPDTYWRASISRTTLGRALSVAGHDVGRVVGARVLERSQSGRVGRIRFDGAAGEVTLSGRRLRAILGESTLKSTLFELRSSEQGFVFVGSGSGHGVGMSQWGARRLAEDGVGYREILEVFYPGARLEQWRGAQHGDRGGDEAHGGRGR